MPFGYNGLDIVAVDLRDGNDTLPLRLVAVCRPPCMTFLIMIDCFLC